MKSLTNISTVSLTFNLYNELLEMIKILFLHYFEEINSRT